MTEEEFDAFFAVSYSRLVGQLSAMTGDWEGARENVLEAFVRGWDQRGRFDLAAAPDSWIRTVAWRLAGIGAGERQAVVLHFMCGLSVEEVAVETGVAVGAVEAWLGNADRDRYAALADEVHDFANEHVQPRLSARQVRELGDRRGRKRRSVAVGGVGALAVAGVIAVALLAGRPSAPDVAPAAGRHTATHGGGVTSDSAVGPGAAASGSPATSSDPRPAPSTGL
ncbi:MAG TPA: sigma factor-like helix-turn-helix DNA-binding protein [Actinospica sp.]|jgi:RNA polymerase sigma-70 factor (ECF subfamily)|nr:sigma factor-like helix-turn-helix DNA-binding protein [Actinospica sp.]